MSIARIYQAVPLAVNQTLRLSDNASHHLARVLRVSVSDEITLFNGTGGEYQAIIMAIDKKAVQVEIKQFIKREAESPIRIDLAQGIARGEKMDYVVQKSVELGVKRIFPLITERCNVRLDNEREAKRVSHWQSVVISACEQSGRNIIPEVCVPQTLEGWLANSDAELRLVLSPHTDNQIALCKIAKPKSVALLIGPEGGLSEKEIQLATKFSFQAIKLGPRILRTETATIAALSVIQYCFGDFA